MAKKEGRFWESEDVVGGLIVAYKDKAHWKTPAIITHRGDHYFMVCLSDGLIYHDFDYDQEPKAPTTQAMMADILHYGGWVEVSKICVNGNRTPSPPENRTGKPVVTITGFNY
jgi:hypothetical protein